MRFQSAWLRVGLLLFSATLRADEPLPNGLYAEFDTPRGVFVAELHYREVPMTVASFVGLAEGTLSPRQGKPFFTGLRWYRVVPGFVIQSGDPDHDLNAGKEDAGGPHTFPDEFVPGLHHGAAGILSMANAGPDTNSCEFFVTLADCTRLNYLHSAFGRVVRGVEALPLIQADDAYTIRILRIGADAEAFRADPAAFAALRSRAKPYTGPAEPGADAFFDDPDALIPVEPPRARYFNYKLANFERANGMRIKARLLARSPSETEDAVPGAYMKALADRLGTRADGVTAVYFADENDWRVWIGDALVPAFLGRPVAPGDLGDGGALHDAKMALIERAQAEGDAAYAAQESEARMAGRAAPPPGQRIKLQTDAILDALLLRFESRR